MKSGLWKSALLLALCSTGCKTTELSDNASTTLDATGSARHRILLIGAGGWESCGSGGDPFTQRIWDSFRTLAEDVGKKTDVDYMIACLNNLSPAKNAANLWYGAQGMPV
jgi:hypothetical protein